ncbi:efflux RND transporter periplasmic adaptor subunit [Sphingomonas japonica]|uniref:RND family efflux transporter MFP subunit n=1 Tax=Sphingomonas japonica TaxID=511662 RepID=A0ABX0U236_9SPHN|nr:efflux RND transporter periplasmic adaptor subunit [Sphingomonas japonica]NIJ23437.1 RND family efflux transporter MFP subunit [Sphingomonas japonica]
MNYETGGIGPGEAIAIEDGREGRPRRRRWIIVAAILLIVAALAAAAYFFRSGEAEGEAGTAAPGAAAPAGGGQIPSVTVAVPGRVTVTKVVSGTGAIAARREMPVGVAGEGGLVTRVLVEPGSWVNSGQVLATVDRSVQAQTAASLAASVRVAQADADLAQAQLERANQLVDRGFISRADIDQRTATRDAAVARVRVAQAQLQEAQARNGRLDIRAPAAGLVLTRAVEPGQIVSSGSGVLFRVAMGGQMEMRAQLSESDLARVSVGVPAEIQPVGSEETFSGEVWQVSPVIDPQTRQGIARIAVRYDRALRPGGFASARIQTGATTAPMLPESAVLNDQQGSFVYILDAENKAQRRPVTVGDVSDAGVAIASGITGTERVVLTAGAFLNPGQKVVPTLTTLKR